MLEHELSQSPDNNQNSQNSISNQNLFFLSRISNGKFTLSIPDRINKILKESKNFIREEHPNEMCQNHTKTKAEYISLKKNRQEKLCKKCAFLSEFVNFQDCEKHLTENERKHKSIINNFYRNFLKKYKDLEDLQSSKEFSIELDSIIKNIHNSKETLKKELNDLIDKCFERAHDEIEIMAVAKFSKFDEQKQYFAKMANNLRDFIFEIETNYERFLFQSDANKFSSKMDQYSDLLKTLTERKVQDIISQKPDLKSFVLTQNVPIEFQKVVTKLINSLIFKRTDNSPQFDRDFVINLTPKPSFMNFEGHNILNNKVKQSLSILPDNDDLTILEHKESASLFLTEINARNSSVSEEWQRTLKEDDRQSIYDRKSILRFTNSINELNLRSKTNQDNEHNFPFRTIENLRFPTEKSGSDCFTHSIDSNKINSIIVYQQKNSRKESIEISNDDYEMFKRDCLVKISSDKKDNGSEQKNAFRKFQKNNGGVSEDRVSQVYQADKVAIEKGEMKENLSNSNDSPIRKISNITAKNRINESDSEHKIQLDKSASLKIDKANVKTEASQSKAIESRNANSIKPKKRFGSKFIFSKMKNTDIPKKQIDPKPVNQIFTKIMACIQNNPRLSQKHLPLNRKNSYKRIKSSNNLFVQNKRMISIEQNPENIKKNGSNFRNFSPKRLLDKINFKKPSKKLAEELKIKEQPLYDKLMIMPNEGMKQGTHSNQSYILSLLNEKRFLKDFDRKSYQPSENKSNSDPLILSTNVNNRKSWSNKPAYGSLLKTIKNNDRFKFQKGNSSRVGVIEKDGQNLNKCTESN